MKIAVIGLGLIGGSLAKSVKAHTAHTVYGAELDAQTLHAALSCGAVDGELTDERLAECRLVLVALYPQDCVRYITENAARFARDAVVIDCAGVKRCVCEPLEALAAACSWTYVGGHPMAGREFSGFAYATDTLFARASMILTPSGRVGAETREFLRGFFLEAGFAAVRFATPEEHDSMIAYTSQLAHIVSGAYVKNPLAARHKGFSAGSFQDMTRVARLSEGMWSELMLENDDLLLPALDDLIFRLSEYRQALEARDEKALRALLREGREKKEALDG